MNKIDRDKITPQIFEKIKEVNDEAGHRTYLEAPEMIRIICEVVEANYAVVAKDTDNLTMFDNDTQVLKWIINDYKQLVKVLHDRAIQAENQLEDL